MSIQDSCRYSREAFVQTYKKQPERRTGRTGGSYEKKNNGNVIGIGADAFSGSSRMWKKIRSGKR